MTKTHTHTHTEREREREKEIRGSYSNKNNTQKEREREEIERKSFSMLTTGLFSYQNNTMMLASSSTSFDLHSKQNREVILEK